MYQWGDGIMVLYHFNTAAVFFYFHTVWVNHCFCEISEFYGTFAPKERFAFLCLSMESDIFIIGVYVALFVRGPL